MRIIIFGRIAQALLALLSLRIMTSLLSPEEVGRWSLLIAVTSFFAFGLINPLGMFINRRLHEWVEEGRVNRYMSYYFVYLLAVSLLAAVMLYGVSLVYSFVPGMSLFWIIGLVMCSIIFGTLNQTFIPSLNLLGYRGWFVLLMLATVGSSLLASVGIAFFLRAGAELWQVGQLIGQAGLAIIGAGLFFKVVIKQKKRKPVGQELSLNYKKVRVLFLFAWPLAIAVLLTWTQSQSYRFVGQNSIGLESLGLFVIGYGLSASLFGIFESVICTYFLPLFYKRISRGNKHEQALAWANYATVMLPAVLIIVAATASVSEELTQILLDKKFSSAAQFVVWGALAEAARVIVGTYALLAHAGMDTKKLMLPNILGAISGPLLVFLFAPIWATHGVGLGLAVASFIAILSSHLFLSNSFEIIMPWVRLFWASILALLFYCLFFVGHIVFGYGATLISSVAWLMVAGLMMLLMLFFLLKGQLMTDPV
ncbi:hypothetical protein OAI35_01150 [Paracoccaceae bacterium]|nr:hypothetical protein [Paracoccaceae bacterium]